MHSTPLPSSSVLSYNTPNIDWSKVTLHDIEKYQEMVAQHLSSLQPEIVNCYDTVCKSHHVLLDNYAHHLVKTLLDCSYHCFPCHRSPSSHELIGWNDGPNFWYRVWDQAGCPSTGALFNLKKTSKR